MVYPYYLGNPAIGVATEANLCALDQDKYFEYRQAIYENVASISTQTGLINVAELVDGLDSEAIAQCLADGTYRTMLESGRASAIRRGVNSTPTFFINDQRIEGNQPYEVLSQIIEQELVQ